MKAVVFRDVGDIGVDDVPGPKVQESTDAIVRLTSSAICGTDLHFIRGTMSGMKPGTILGHEGVGIIEELGDGVRNRTVGDRVIIPSTIACGTCSYCRAGYFAQCDKANPNGSDAGTAFFGGPESTGPFDGLQAELARVPYANVGLVRVPDDVTDEQAILLSDIFPTGWFGAVCAEVSGGDTVVVFGCGPVGIFAIISAYIQGAARVIAVDQKPDRLETARRHGAETVDFSVEHPVETIRELTGGIGPDRAIDAVGVDAQGPDQSPEDVEANAPEQHPSGDNWHPGKAPAQVLSWAVDAVAKAGTIGIVGVYPPTMEHFPIGAAMNKNLTFNMGNCHHRAYIPHLLELVRSGAVDPSTVLTDVEELTDAVSAYEAFDTRQPGWQKVELLPAAPAAG